MDLSFLTKFATPVIIGICLCVGFVIKESLPSIPNRIIPLLMAVLGVCINIWLHELALSPDIVLGGLFSGLVSTGCYEMFRNLIHKEL